jgi:hypothetical protein
VINGLLQRYQQEQLIERVNYLLLQSGIARVT